MVSGCVTSPCELSRIDSGEARLMVIFEKSLLIFLFFLNDILYCLSPASPTVVHVRAEGSSTRKLVHCNFECETSEFVHQHVERLRDVRLPHVLALNDRLVCFRTTDNVVGLNREDFLEDVRRTECLDRPHFHFSETLTTELCLTTQRLLRDEGVRTDRTCVHLIVNKVTEFQHVCHTNRYRLIKLLTG